MENVVLIIHLLLALSLIGVVLLQRSEGGGLGMGGGGGGATAGRSAATAMGKLTWILATAFIVTSITLTIIAAQQSAGSSVLDRITDAPAPAATDDPTQPDAGDNLLPPSAGDDAPLTPTAD
ncbi:preprotein translocase subunit SecG [Roseovarius sp. MMSF_3281]|uniref:preprotein translocase subunit SecG n=1 Tax=Roseovarius sp. MMSF_3281 TaxID=3046694 RepID=UPI0027400C67|nr:preprotein translocase subunit SecG [Roseovarius sp. MMSF_3281]